MRDHHDSSWQAGFQVGCQHFWSVAWHWQCHGWHSFVQSCCQRFAGVAGLPQAQYRASTDQRLLKCVCWGRLQWLLTFIWGSMIAQVYTICSCTASIGFWYESSFILFILLFNCCCCWIPCSHFRPCPSPTDPVGHCRTMDASLDRALARLFQLGILVR